MVREWPHFEISFMVRGMAIFWDPLCGSRMVTF